MKKKVFTILFATALALTALAQDTVHFTEFQKDTDVYYQPYQYDDYVATTQGWYADKVVFLHQTQIDFPYSVGQQEHVTETRIFFRKPNNRQVTIYGIAAAIVPDPDMSYGAWMAEKPSGWDTLRIVDSTYNQYQTRYYHVAIPARATPYPTWNQSCDSTVVGSYDTTLLCYEFYFQHPITVDSDFYIGVFQRGYKPSCRRLRTWSQRLCFEEYDAIWFYSLHAVQYNPSHTPTHWEYYNTSLLDRDWDYPHVVMAIVSPPDEDIPNCGSVAGLQAETSDTGQVALEWEPVPCASGYQVAYGTEKPPMDTVVTTNATSLQIDGLLQGSLLYARVRAICHYTSPFTDTTYYGPWSDDVYYEIPMWQDTSDTTGIALASGNDSRITLRPNPTRDRLTVERPDAGPATLEVFNAKGQKVLSMTTEQQSVTLDISALPSGSYLLRVTTAEGSSVRTFVVGR